VNVHLVVPAWGHGKNLRLYQGVPPIGVAYVAAALLEAGHDVRVTDAILEGWDNVMPYGPMVARGLDNDAVVARIAADVELIGISVLSTTCWPLVVDLCARLKRAWPATPIVLGGEHPTVLPRFCLQTSQADFVVRGEGEAVVVELAEVLASGDRSRLHAVRGLAFQDGDTYVETPRRPRIRDLDALPWPAWQLFDIDGYHEKSLVGASLVGGRRSLPIVASRGCVNRCTFCTAAAVWTPVWIPRSPASIVDEMEHCIERYGVRDFSFYDLTVVVDKRWAIALCHEILDRELDITWRIGSRMEHIDAPLARLMKRAGLEWILLAPESGSAETRRRIRKPVKAATIDRAVRACTEAGIATKVQVLSGLPGDRHRDAWKNLALAFHLGRLGVDMIGTAIFAPYPGTEAFDALVAAGALRFDDDLVAFIVGNNELERPLPIAGELSPWSTKAYQVLDVATFVGARFLFHPLSSLRSLGHALGSRDDRDYFEKFLKAFLALLDRAASPPATARPMPWPAIDYGRFSTEDVLQQR